jgi:SAM-dependent methyltransferase
MDRLQLLTTTGTTMSEGQASIPPDVLEHRKWLISLLDLAEARYIVDLGCGKGEDLALIADRARADAELVGLDSWSAQIEKARTSLQGDTRISFLEYRVETGPLPFDDASVDILYSNNLLECLRRPRVLIQEIGRVLRPGGQILCAHWDWDSQIIDADDKSVVRRIVHAFCDWQQDWMEHADGWMGRRLSGLFGSDLFEGGVLTRTLTNTRFEAPWFGHGRIEDFRLLIKHGLVMEQDYERLLAEVRARARSGRYFYSITCYVFCGRKKAAQ